MDKAKKIGILTFHQSVNNGAVMQAYSLSKRLKQDFPDSVVEIIDYRMKCVEKAYSYNLKSYLKEGSLVGRGKKIVKFILNPLMFKRLNRRTEIFHQCINQLPLSSMKIEDGGMDEVIQYINSNYDILIVGSDAIWNHVSRGFPNIYLPDCRVKCHKLSYAASCYGMDFLKCSEQTRKTIGESLNDFYAIGIRDDATRDFVEWSGCTVTPYHTCDPTAFLDVDDLPVDVEKLEEKLKKKGFSFDKETIGIMGNEKMLKMLRSFYDKKYQLVSLYNYLPGADVQLYDLTPYEWAYVFRYFKLTFTTYFHGTMLSLRNGTPLICIALNTEFSKKHTPKTLDLLKRVGFEDWYFETDYKTVNFKEIKEKADFLISSNMKTKIIEAIEAEALSYREFEKNLRKLMNSKEK